MAVSDCLMPRKTTKHSVTSHHNELKNYTHFALIQVSRCPAEYLRLGNYFYKSLSKSRLDQN